MLNLDIVFLGREVHMCVLSSNSVVHLEPITSTSFARTYVRVQNLPGLPISCKTWAAASQKDSSKLDTTQIDKSHSTGFSPVLRDRTEPVLVFCCPAFTECLCSTCLICTMEDYGQGHTKMLCFLPTLMLSISR